jgi:PilZ domain
VKLRFSEMEGDPPHSMDQLTRLPGRGRAHAKAEMYSPEISQWSEPEQQVRERIAQLMARNNRRHHPRLTQPAEISIQQLTPNAETISNVVSGEVQNLSRGGVCIAAPVPLLTSSVVRCQIGLPDLRFAIPTLMQVVWVEQTGSSQYSVGLSYLV